MLLLRACHPLPAAAVTMLTALLALGLRLPAATAALVTVFIAVTQLAIGWSNDAIDAARDRAAGRADKPLAAGAHESAPTGRRTVAAAAAVATGLCVVAAFAWGWPTGLLGSLMLVGGLSYNWPLKSTMLSVVPYLVAFAALPAFIAAAAGRTGPGWLVVAAGLLGGSAHLLNAVPDLADDAATGVRGLPHRLGARGSLLTAAAALLTATAVLIVGASPPWWAAAAVGALAVTMTTIGWYAQPRTSFRAVMVVAVLDVLLLTFSGVL